MGEAGERARADAEGVVALYSVLLYVRDLETAAAFYRDLLGLRPVGRAGGPVLMLRAGAGGCQVVLHRADQADWPDSQVKTEPGGHALTFAVDDPDAWAERLRAAGVTVLEGPLDQVWGRVVFVTDPDGRTVGLARPGSQR